MNYISYSKYTSQFFLISSNSLSEVGSFDTDPGYPLTCHISHRWSRPWQSLRKTAATNSCDKHLVVGKCQGALGWWCHIVIWPYIIYILYIIYIYNYLHIYIYVTPSWKHPQEWPKSFSHLLPELSHELLLKKSKWHGRTCRRNHSFSKAICHMHSAACRMQFSSLTQGHFDWMIWCQLNQL